MKFLVCFQTVWAIAGANLVTVAHAHTAENKVSMEADETRIKADMTQM